MSKEDFKRKINEVESNLKDLDEMYYRYMDDCI